MNSIVTGPLAIARFKHSSTMKSTMSNHVNIDKYNLQLQKTGTKEGM